MNELEDLKSEAAGTPGDDLKAKAEWQLKNEAWGYRGATERIAVQALTLDEQFADEYPEMPNRRKQLQSLAVQMMEIWVGAEKNGEDYDA